MSDYIQGWHRKCGLVALIVALIVLVAWGRSQISRDRIPLPIARNVTTGITLAPRGIEFYRMHDVVVDAMQTTAVGNGGVVAQDGPTQEMGRKTELDRSVQTSVAPSSRLGHEANAETSSESATDVGDIENSKIVRVPVKVSYAVESVVAEIPYWAVITPLTILSAVLLLVPPGWKHVRRDAPTLESLATDEVRQ